MLCIADLILTIISLSLNGTPKVCQGQDILLVCRGIYQEYDNILYKEIDYIAEGRNADRFRRNFQPDPAVRVPHVHWQLTSTRAITLDYMPGIKITDLASLTASGIDTAGVARQVIWLRQI